MIYFTLLLGLFYFCFIGTIVVSGDKHKINSKPTKIEVTDKLKSILQSIAGSSYQLYRNGNLTFNSFLIKKIQNDTQKLYNSFIRHQ